MNGDLATPQVCPKPRDLAQRYLAAKTLLFWIIIPNSQSFSDSRLFQRILAGARSSSPKARRGVQILSIIVMSSSLRPVPSGQFSRGSQCQIVTPVTHILRNQAHRIM